MHWLQYGASFVAAFAIYFDCAFFNYASFQKFVVKIFKFCNCNGYYPLSYFAMPLKEDFIVKNNF